VEITNQITLLKFFASPFVGTEYRYPNCFNSKMTLPVIHARGKSDGMDTKLTNKAVVALLKHHEETIKRSIDEKQKLPLLNTDVAVQVQFGLEVAPKQMKVKPIRLSVPHSIYNMANIDGEDSGGNARLDDAEICLIVKDESKEMVQELIQQFPQYMKNIKKVLTLQSLRTKHGEYQKRRELLATYSHFLADDRILPMLTSALGKDFLKAKKQPIPVRVTRREALPFAIKRALVGATYLHIPDGTCITVRAGYSSQNVEHLVSNISAIIEQVPPKIPRKWANVRSISVKLPNSVALPIYNKTPEELMKIAGMAGLPSLWNGDKPSTTKQLESDGKKLPTDERDDQTVASGKSASGTAAKSPLLKALQKQKQSTNARSSETLPVSKKKRKQELSEASSVPKKSIDPTKDGSPSKRVKRSETRKDPIEEEVKEKGKSDGPLATGSKQSFISAEKFSGSKKGYVFRNGKRGLGYYVDNPPVVDKVALSKLLRSGSEKSSFKNSGKKRRGK
jgi:ribosome biogenesis protein UTP30